MGKVIAVLFSLLTLLAFAPEAKAIGTEPNFPSCTNPSGTLKVSYESGKHAVIGDLWLHEGRDKVYWVEGGIALQCFCPNEGDGIQTNWWNVPNITQQEIDRYRALGWHFAPTGSAWGLLDDPYLAKNFTYSCNSGGTGGGGSSTSTQSMGGSVLAATGGNFMLIGIIGLGVILTIIGAILRKKSNA